MQQTNRFPVSEADFTGACGGDGAAFERLFSPLREGLRGSMRCLDLPIDEIEVLLAETERESRIRLVRREVRRRRQVNPFFSRVHYEGLIAWLKLTRPGLLTQLPTCETSTERLLLAVMDGNQSAFELLFTRFESAVINAAFVCVHRLEPARDLSQETFREIHRALQRKAIADLRSFLSYLLKTCRQHVKRWKRNRSEQLVERGLSGKAESGYEGLPAGGLPTDLLAQHRLDANRVRRLAEERAGDRNVEAAVWHHVFGLAEKELAWLLGHPIGTVKVRIHRGVAMLREAMGEG